MLFVGRADDQVKVGGRRIELGEVENALQDVPGVTAAAAAVRKSEAGVPVLVGYLVTEAPLDRAAARGAARRAAALRRDAAARRSRRIARAGPRERWTGPHCRGRFRTSIPPGSKGSRARRSGSSSSGRRCSGCPCPIGAPTSSTSEEDRSAPLSSFRASAPGCRSSRWQTSTTCRSCGRWRRRSRRRTRHPATSNSTRHVRRAGARSGRRRSSVFRCSSREACAGSSTCSPPANRC